jgi:hypothetical protein
VTGVLTAPGGQAHGLCSSHPPNCTVICIVGLDVLPAASPRNTGLPQQHVACVCCSWGCSEHGAEAGQWHRRLRIQV